MRIRTNLFIVTLATILALSISFAVSIFIWQMFTNHEKQLNTYRQESESVLRQIDDELSNMNAISLNAAYSNFVKEQFRGYLDAKQSAPQKTYSQLQSAKLLSEVLFNLIGPSLSVPQVYIYTSTSGAFGSGLDTGYREYRSTEMDWYTHATQLAGAKYISAPRTDPRIGAATAFEKDTPYISLVRMFFDSMNVRQGYVEVLQRASRLFGAVDALDSEAAYMVLHPQSGIVYGSRPAAKLQTDLLQLYASSGGNVWLPMPQDDSLALFLPSAQSDYVLVSVLPRRALFSEYRQLLLLLLAATLLVGLLMGPMVYSLSKTVTGPIHRLYRSIHNTDLESLSTERFEDLGTNIYELTALDTALRRMKYKLNDSMEKLLQTQRHEMHARMLALQAQMNPHFLYNTMATLSAMAADELNEEIEELCENISDLLRYISADDSPLVSVQNELAFTEKYMLCMKARFPSLVFSIQVPPKMQRLQIPKLGIQLLVENAVKHATTQKPPWTICVTGSMDDGQWRLCVQDNGPGFSQKAREHFESRIAEIRSTGTFPALSLDGMGILNVYIRLWLLFGRDTVFTIENRAQGGASVTVGARTHMPSVQDSCNHNEK